MPIDQTLIPNISLMDYILYISPARGTSHGRAIRLLLDRPGEIKGRKVNGIVDETQNYDSRAFSQQYKQM